MEKIQWRHFETEDLLFVDKPDGIATHAPHPGLEGYIETWQEQLRHEGRLSGRPESEGRLSDRPEPGLWVCHRLDKTTSGAMVFAKTKEAANRLRLDFENRRVGKTYWFLTDRRSDQEELLMESEIRKEGSAFVSDPSSSSPNSKTRFARIKRSPFFELWAAYPESGKPHQIRLHARDLGLPILGDGLYGGSSFARLCLHAVELRVPGAPVWTCPAPRLFERLGVLKANEIVTALCAIDRRYRQFDFLRDPEMCLRLMEFEAPGLQMDLLGSQAWLQWFREADPTPRELERWALVSRILGRPLLIQKRWNRGEKSGPAPKWRDENYRDVWTARENGVTYEFRTDSGESHGLFLDQRANRTRVREISEGKSVLNLFAYTGGFGIAAALGGATSVTTVDLSKAAIEWSKRNFALNPEAGAGDNQEFFAADCFFFLERAAKRDRRWDLIVCDPPIFSRGERVFRLEKDLPLLVKLCRSVLAKNGTLFFSTHFEGWDYVDIEKILRKNFPSVKIERGQLERDVPQPPCTLKSFFLRF
ncbi:MAG: class I SAM-dependent methyltransferase [Bdellovibrionaceae bacterium]|nr:class I SAM-dependent methyltransferase [Pseudobdellovibrionaceae bacterium]